MDDAPRWFRLYVPGPGPRSDAVERAVRAYGDQRYGVGAWKLEVTDVRADPESAGTDGIFLSPTLHRLSPAPRLRWFGDLSDADALARALSEADV